MRATHPAKIPIGIEEIISGIKGIFNSGYIERFEEEFKRYTGINYVKATSSGRFSLYLALKVLGIEKGSEIITTTFTCETIANTIVEYGSKPVFADIELETFNMSPDSTLEHINKKTRAIVAVHMYGIPSKIDEIRKIATDNNIFLIEDCAQALGAVYDGVKLGNYGDISFFSFGKGKHITTGQGGIIATNNKKYLENIDKHLNKLEKSIFLPFKSLFEIIAYKVALSPYIFGVIYPIIYMKTERESKLSIKKFSYRFSEVQASIGLTQLKKIDILNEKRNNNAFYLINNLKDLDYIQIPKINKKSIPAFLKFPILVENESKKKNIIKKLKKIGIYTAKLPQNFKYDFNKYKNTKEVYKKAIILPCYPELNREELIKIVNTIRQT